MLSVSFCYFVNCASLLFFCPQTVPKGLQQKKSMLPLYCSYLSLVQSVFKDVRKLSCDLQATETSDMKSGTDEALLPEPVRKNKTERKTEVG